MKTRQLLWLLPLKSSKIFVEKSIEKGGAFSAPFFILLPLLNLR